MWGRVEWAGAELNGIGTLQCHVSHLFGYMVIARPILAQNEASAESNGLFRGVLGGAWGGNLVLSMPQDDIVMMEYKFIQS